MPRQLAIPPRLAPDGQFATVEQDTPLEAAQRVNVLCHTPPGWFDDHPKFGLADQHFRKGGANIAEVQAQLDTLGPDVLALAAHDPSLLDQGLDFLGLTAASNA